MKFTALVERGAQLKAIEVRGVDTQRERAVSRLADYITPGVWEAFVPAQQQVILGKGVADQLQAAVGDWIT
ncbi:hypothetical protein, partial [Bacillus cereus group sp. Bce007]|uniref:hypothetical protein n=1 Tax=Bacillus cereus group sp. Bce007 TaxID=3445254 RepID=UPI003F699C30